MAAAFVFWGLAPLYWKLVESLPARVLLGERILWSAGTALLLLALRHRGLPSHLLKSLVRLDGVLLRRAICALLIGGNWGLFLWAVQHDRVLDISLAYFINPLLNVLLGMVLLRERLNAARLCAVGLAAIAVLNLVLVAGTTPWLALAMASSFAGYSLLKKSLRRGSVEGLFIETTILVPAALLLVAGSAQASGPAPPWLPWALPFCGLVTLTPLWLFARGVRELPLSVTGLLQYLAPSLQFLLAVSLFGEALKPGQLLSFSLIWIGLALFSADLLQASRKAKARIP